MKTFLYVVGCLLIVGALALAIAPGPAGHMGPLDTLACCVMCLIAAISIVGGAVIGAIERATKLPR